MPMKCPPQAGDLIRTEVIEALGLGVSKAAEVLKARRDAPGIAWVNGREAHFPTAYRKERAITAGQTDYFFGGGGGGGKN
jgi:hypothetical protein